MTKTEQRRRAARTPLDHDPERLRRIRIERGLRQNQTARAAGISKGSLSELERGTRNASPEMLAKLASALKCTVAELLPEHVAAPR